jgi:hypothetical protein
MAAARALQQPEALARPSPAPAGRARPRCFTPLSDFHMRRLAKLEQLVGTRYRGWSYPLGGGVAVDVLKDGIAVEDLKSDGSGAGVERYTGETLHGAIGAALRAARGA